MPANASPVNEVFYVDVIFDKLSQFRRLPHVVTGALIGFSFPARMAEDFFGKLENFVQKLFEVSKSLLYSKLRCFWYLRFAGWFCGRNGRLSHRRVLLRREFISGRAC